MTFSLPVLLSHMQLLAIEIGRYPRQYMLQAITLEPSENVILEKIPQEKNWLFHSVAEIWSHAEPDSGTLSSSFARPCAQITTCINQEGKKNLYRSYFILTCDPCSYAA